MAIITAAVRSGILLLASISVASALVTKDGSGKLPALGWNSWNAYRCDVNEEKVLNAARSIKDLGLADLGYNYVNIDDCWSVRGRRRSGTNQIIPDSQKFPSGIDGLAKKIHSMGLKLGIYGDAGTETCAGYPGSLYYEDIDASTFAAWGVDYLKYDNCNVPASWPSDKYHACHPDYNGPTGPNSTCINDPGLAPPGYNWADSSTAKRFNRMRDALHAQNQTILYSLCQWGQAAVETWGNGTAQSWRMTDDIFPNFPRVKHIVNYNSFKLNHVNFWSHNDADMLEVGNGDLSFAETHTHFALWAAMKSPLLIGTDLSKLSQDRVNILKNKYLIKFNQDPVQGKPATPYNWNWEYNDARPPAYWSGDYGDGSKLVLITNYDEQHRTMRADWGQVPGLKKGASYETRNAWSDFDLGCQRNGWDFDLEPHDTGAFVIGKECR